MTLTKAEDFYLQVNINYANISNVVKYCLKFITKLLLTAFLLRVDYLSSRSLTHDTGIKALVIKTTQELCI